MQTIFNHAKRKPVTQTVFVLVYKDEYDRIQYDQFYSRSSREQFGPNRGKPLYRINVKPKSLKL